MTDSDAGQSRVAGRTDQLHLLPRHQETLEALLREHLPGIEVWAYGSRVNGQSHDGSDLDLVLRAPDLQEVPIGPLADLTEALHDSTLPFLVEARDWARLPECFHREIERGYVVIQNAASEDGADSASDWREVTLGEIAEIVGGSTPSTKESDNFDGEIPWLTPKDLSGVHDRYISRGTRNLSRKGLDSCSAKLVPANTVLLSTRAPIGYVAIAANPISTNQGFRNLVTHENICSEFIYYWLKNNTETLERHASGSTFREISGSALKQIRLRLPPLAEQLAIAHILGTLDDKIELNRRMNETLEAMAQALFKSWFVDFEPVRAKMEGRWRPDESLLGLPAYLYDLFPDRLVESELGEVPEGWEVKSLEQIVDLNPHEPMKRGTTAPYLNMAALSTSGPNPNDAVLRDFTSGTRFRNGDTLLARITPCLENGKTAFVQTLPKGTVGWGSTEFIVMRAIPPVPPEYTYLLGRDTDFREHAIQNMTGTSGRQRVQVNALAHYLVPSPKADLWAQFSSLIRSMFGSIEAARKESCSLTAQRDALLPKLVSGTVRVQPD